MKLLQHFRRMQGMASLYLQPPLYEAQTPQTTLREVDNNLPNVSANNFVGDMLYMLDGPEQREAEVEARFDFIAESMVTASGSFHGEKVSIGELITALKDMSAAAERLDRIKKALFYGRDYIPNPTRPSPSRPSEDDAAFPIIERVADQIIAAGNPPGTGDCACGRGGEWGHDSGCPESQNEADIRKNVELALHAIIGVATEAGEMIDAWLDAYMHGKTLDLVNLKEEFGDNQWYVAVFLRAFSQLTFNHDGVTFYDLHRSVNLKLRHRFPDGFTEFDANHRDLNGERRILEGEDFFGVAEDESLDPKVRIKALSDHAKAEGFIAPTFDAEEVEAGQGMRGQPVEPPFGCKPLEFPDEPKSGVDPAPGKLSDEK